MIVRIKRFPGALARVGVVPFGKEAVAARGKKESSDE